MSIGRGIKTALGTVFGVRTIKRQASYMKDDVKRIKQDFSIITQSLQDKNELVDDWNEFVMEHDVTTERLRRQYFFRTLSAYLLIIAMLFSVYLIFEGKHGNAALAGLLIAGVLFFRNSLRLYQIRHHTLCSVKSYLLCAKSHFKEIFPLRLPKNWAILKKNGVVVGRREDSL